MEIISSLIDAFNDALELTDDIYAETLQFQEALEASFNSTHHHHQTQPSSSSTSSLINSCEICIEDKASSDMLQLQGCPHSFCHVCIRKHVEYKLQENIIIISCPDQDCRNLIQPRSLRPFLDQYSEVVIDRWEEAIAESSIVAWEKIHCPFEDCAEILVTDGMVITECECPWCHRLFCAKCKVSWHEGFDCKEFQRFSEGEKEEKKLRALAKENKWKSCPHCEVFVDKIEGCMHITCRCKFEFCYVCGKNWSETHWSTCRE